MKHNHDADINVSIPKQDLEDLIDKITDSAITIIGVATAAHILRTLLTKEPR